MNFQEVFDDIKMQMAIDLISDNLIHENMRKKDHSCCQSIIGCLVAQLIENGICIDEMITYIFNHKGFVNEKEGYGFGFELNKEQLKERLLMHKRKIESMSDFVTSDIFKEQIKKIKS